MKKLYRKLLVFSVIALAQLTVSFVANAAPDIKPGFVLIGKGVNQNQAPGQEKCNAYDPSTGKLMGTTSTNLITGVHTIALNGGGSLSVTLPPEAAVVHDDAVTDDVLVAHPDIAKIIASSGDTDPNNYRTVTVTGDNYRGNPRNPNWGWDDTIGVSAVHAKCLFLVHNGIITHCVWCEYFMQY